MAINSNKLIDNIYEVVDTFIHDWQNSPYEWNTEIELQAEIYGRIVNMLRDFLIQKAKYKVKDERFLDMQKYRRVSCEPATNYRDKNGVLLYGFPDIVVYDDFPNPESPPDFSSREKNWPMLWVCEIKYQNEFYGGCSTGQKKWDIEKMQYLMEYNEGKTRYACCLDFDRTIPNTMDSLKISEKGNIRNYRIMLPKSV